MKHIKEFILERLHINKDLVVQEGIGKRIRVDERLEINKNTESIFKPFKFPELDITVQLPFKIYISDLDEIVEIYRIEESSDKYGYLFYDENDELFVRLSKSFGIGNLFINCVKDPRNTMTPKLYNVNGKKINNSYKIELYEPNECIIKESKDTNNYANMIIVNEDDQILILQRSGYMKRFPGKWGFPGGHINDDEDSKTAAIRELKEETGIELTYPEETKCINVFERKDNDGHSFTYYFIKLDKTPNIKISREHRRYEWYHYDKKDDRVYKWMPDVYELIQKYYQDEFKVA